jgi:hypothetical protein
MDDQHPAMIRVNKGGAAVSVEVWRLSAEGQASVLQKEPPGVCIGKVMLADGVEVLSVMAEPILGQDQRETTQFDGWQVGLGD